MAGLTGSELAGLRQAMLLGTARGPLVPPLALSLLIAGGAAAVDPMVSILALVGQHRRFERPMPVEPLETPQEAHRLHADPRPILPEPARRALSRVLDWVREDRKLLAVRAVSRRVKAAGFRLHPFDLPRIWGALESHEDRMGAALSALSGAMEGMVAYPEVTAGNWTEASRQARIEFLRRLRVSDPAMARALAETAFRSAEPEIRVEIAEAVAIRPGPEDLPLLQEAAKDRAETVRAAALVSLALVPGAPAHNERVAAAAACFQPVVHRELTSKFLHIVRIEPSSPFNFVPPAAANRLREGGAIKQLFESVSLPELSAALREPAGVLLDAVPRDLPEVFWALLAKASNDCDTASLQILTEWRMRSSDRDLLSHVLPKLAASHVILSYGQATAALLMPAWRETVAELISARRDNGSLILMATMLPARAMPAFLATLDSSSSAVQAARAFAEFVIALETARQSVTAPT